MAWRTPNATPSETSQPGITPRYGSPANERLGDTDGVTARCPGRAGDEPHRKPFGKPCPRCERPQEHAA